MSPDRQRRQDEQDDDGQPAEGDDATDLDHCAGDGTGETDERDHEGIA